MPRLNLSKILIVDIESTCWEKQEDKPKAQFNEIIQVGIVELKTQNLMPLRENSIFIQPTTSEISQYCTDLTGIKKETLEGAATFTEVCSILKYVYDSKKKLWCSWGEYDRHMFQKQCSREKIDYPFSDSHINLKNLFSLMWGLEQGVGQWEALNLAGKEMVGQQHEALSDAINITQVLKYMIKKYRNGISYRNF